MPLLFGKLVSSIGCTTRRRFFRISVFRAHLPYAKPAMLLRSVINGDTSCHFSIASTYFS
ncbi:hypothetical protein CW304_30635 [Bacillus sp. UFRGS-B20]|nr:hypothetical protein CW304_30635 [Bacillus sp. UFRGS-B20]